MTEAVEGARAQIFHTLRLAGSSTQTGYWMRAAILLSLLLVVVIMASFPSDQPTAANGLRTVTAG
jgi:hypothetical protein